MEGRPLDVAFLQLDTSTRLECEPRSVYVRGEEGKALSLTLTLTLTLIGGEEGKALSPDVVIIKVDKSISSSSEGEEQEENNGLETTTLKMDYLDVRPHHGEPIEEGEDVWLYGYPASKTLGILTDKKTICSVTADGFLQLDAINTAGAGMSGAPVVSIPSVGCNPNALSLEPQTLTILYIIRWARHRR